ncbi:multicopper oxidase domain-containing protein (plasmid) [Rhodococcus qingshengii]|uniref:multicopper oxidase domain-containing protein n=1 Tax=Rhodococcus qingshengii TaxID=334542 RepID=UPI0011EC0A8B|nr:multicopper oxidase domain-containing protein [Rhodococcus qingshengii]QEM25364.1 multicopper oxidase domain-containing protein [Rhodococcus qingshengii]QEM25628.1 multicopper oxidase domain-containing protein [Rhodococcus qingshengii]
MSAPSRRQLLIGGALAGSAGLMMNAGRVAGASPTEHPGDTHPGAAAPDGDGGVRHGGTSGATFRAGRQVNHLANGFHPTAMLRDFDYGTTSVSSDGRTLREWEIFAADEEIEVAPGVYYPAWTFNSRIPGPALRCSEGDRLRVKFVNGSAHPHTMHFHGIHPAEMDGIPGVGRGIIEPGESFTYEFDATPFGLHLYHCHVSPLAEHIARGMYGTFIVDPAQGRPAADEMVMVMHGYNTTFDGQGNQLYAVNGIPFHYMHEPVQVKRGELVRIYLVNILEYDPINSFHIHGNFFDYYPTGTRLEPSEFTDTIVQAQGQRGICELRFPHPGKYMFHAHKTEFADLGWMGFFEVTE